MSLLRFLLPFLVLTAGVQAAEAPGPSRFYAAVSMTKAQKNSPTPLDSGLYLRAADGQWANFGPRILGVAGLAVSPVNSDVMLLASSDGVVRTPDGGRTWRKVTGWEVADVRSIVFDRHNPSLVYAATAWGPLRSIDGGETWQLAHQGLAKFYCQTILADSAHAGRVLLGTEDGVYVSVNGAALWQRAKFPAVSVLRLAQSAAEPKFILAGTQGRGAWLSHDGGASWNATDPGSASANLYAVAVSPRTAAQLAVGGWGIGVRVSADGGKTWADRSAGLPVRNVFVLAFDPDVKGRLWASTFEEGSYYSDDLGFTWQNGGLYGAYGFDYIFVPPAR